MMCFVNEEVRTVRGHTSLYVQLTLSSNVYSCHDHIAQLKEFIDLINKYGGDMPNTMGVPEEAITKASKMAVCKVNIDTDLRLALTAKIRQVFAESPAEFDPRKYLGPGREAIKQMVKRKLHVLGCAGKADICR